MSEASMIRSGHAGLLFIPPDDNAPAGGASPRQIAIPQRERQRILHASGVEASLAGFTLDQTSFSQYIVVSTKPISCIPAAFTIHGQRRQRCSRRLQHLKTPPVVFLRGWGCRWDLRWFRTRGIVHCPSSCIDFVPLMLFPIGLDGTNAAYCSLQMALVSNAQQRSERTNHIPSVPRSGNTREGGL